MTPIGTLSLCGKRAERWCYLMLIWVGSRGTLFTGVEERSVLAQGQNLGEEDEKAGKAPPDGFCM